MEGGRGSGLATNSCFRNKSVVNMRKHYTFSSTVIKWASLVVRKLYNALHRRDVYVFNHCLETLNTYVSRSKNGSLSKTLSLHLPRPYFIILKYHVYTLDERNVCTCMKKSTENTIVWYIRGQIFTQARYKMLFLEEKSCELRTRIVKI